MPSSADVRSYLVRKEARINPSLDGIRALAHALGDPQNAYSAIQVTGTNGKTSTARMVAALLRGEGLRVGLYTSPHLVSFPERISVSGREIGEEDFDRRLSRIVSIAEELGLAEELTGFELLTALAFSHFSEQGVETAVFEVGMGGRWDATSLAGPKVSVITNVELDHMDYLGPTREEIAAEKAHVIKEGTVAVTGEDRPEILGILRRRAGEVGGTLKVLGEDFGMGSEHGATPRRRDLSGPFLRKAYLRGLFKDYTLPLPAWGEHQVANLALAVTACEAFLGRALDAGEAGRSLSALTFPGRLELLSGAPPVLLDGAHNPAAALALAAFLAQGGPVGPAASADPEPRQEGLILVLAILADKDIPGILGPLLPLARMAVYSQNDSPRCAPAEVLARLGPTHPPEEKIIADLGEALAYARRSARSGDLICVTGSLYTVGLARRLLLGAQSR